MATYSFRRIVRANLGDRPSVAELALFMAEDTPGQELDADRLFPQLWAMSLVEPIIEQPVDDLYDEYLDELVTALERLDANHLRA